MCPNFGHEDLSGPKDINTNSRTNVCGKICYWEKLSRGVSKPGGSHFFSGKVQIVLRTLSGLFLVGAVNRPRKRKRTNRENPRRVPGQIGKIPEKIWKVPKKTRKEGQVQIGKLPRLNPPPPRLAALDPTARGHLK